MQADHEIDNIIFVVWATKLALQLKLMILRVHDLKGDDI